MNNNACPVPKYVSLNHHLATVSKAKDSLRHLLLDLARSAKYIQNAIRTTSAGLAGTKNQFGEEQLQLDVLSDEAIRVELCESGLVASFASEEQDEVIELSPTAPYSVVYDPLDGSSLVEADFAIGSIFGIYEGNGIIGRKPKEQVAAVYTLYGPRTILIYSTGNGVHEFLLNDVGEFVLLREFLGIADEAKNFSPGNLRVLQDNPGYDALLHAWLKDGLTLRYSGCMVADIHHIFSKGQGVFSNVGAKGKQGKLRLAFECGPFAYLAKQAGGSASDGTQDILEKPIGTIDERTSILIGSSKAVEAAVQALRS